MTLKLQKLRGRGKLVLLRVLKHAACWTLFMFYELALLYFFDQHWGKIADGLVFYLLNIGLFYVHADILLPYVFRRARPYLAVLPGILAELCVYLGLKYGFEHFFRSFSLGWGDRAGLVQYVFLNGWRGLYFLGLGTVYRIIRRIFAYRREIAEADKRQLLMLMEKADMEKNLAEVRYAYLQQQISPHFLFNTLNFMYNSVYKLSPAVSAHILQLSDMMRYSLAGPGSAEGAELREELRQIRNFIRISRLRYDFRLQVRLDLRQPPAGLRIIPLVLLTLTENVFKHGNLKIKAQPARISLSVNQANLLKFVTWNLKKGSAPGKRLKSIGLQNTIKRLDHAYGQRYRLDIRDESESYQLELYLQL